MQALVYGERTEWDDLETTDIPSDYADQALDYHEQLIEALADFDDELAEKYLEGADLTADDIRNAIRKATISLEFCGVIPSAFKNKGVQSVLESVVNYLPCPLDLPPMKGENEKGAKLEVAGRQCCRRACIQVDE